jgi:putative transposase
MTTAHDIDWPQVLAERLTTTHPDVLREGTVTLVSVGDLGGFVG